MNASDKARANLVGTPANSAGGSLGDGTRGLGDIIEAAAEKVSTVVPTGGTLTVTGALTASGTVTGANVTATATVTGADITCTDDLTTVDLFVTGDVTLGTSKTIALTTSAIFKDSVGGNTLLTITDEGTTGSLSCNADGRVVSKMGTGTARPSLVGVINLDVTAVASATAGPNDLITYSLPANSLTAAGRGIRIYAWGTTTNNADAKTLTLNFGSQEVLTQAMTVNEANTWEIEAIIARTGASTQDVFAKVTQLTGTALRKGTVTAGTQTETGAIIIKCTATEEITQEGLLVEAL